MSVGHPNTSAVQAVLSRDLHTDAAFYANLKQNNVLQTHLHWNPNVLTELQQRMIQNFVFVQMLKQAILTGSLDMQTEVKLSPYFFL